MSQLRDYLQTYIRDIEGILREHQDDDAIIQAAEDRWKNARDPRYLVFLEPGEPTEIRLPVSPRGGGGSDERKPNETPNPKP